MDNDYGDSPNPNQITTGAAPKKGTEPVYPWENCEKCRHSLAHNGGVLCNDHYHLMKKAK